jgi:dTDP-4-amino-4,6-dideoxygalactose transaminase
VSDIPYARPYWNDEEERALLEVVRSGFWTNGGQVVAFERELGRIAGAPVVTTSSGTTAILALLHVLGADADGPRLLVTPALNFAACAASARLLGWDVGICDVLEDDLNISGTSLSQLLDEVGIHYARIVVVPVHYAGHAFDVSTIAAVCRQHGADLVEDACHAVGGMYANTSRPIGSSRESLATYFSFHPVKPIASGEGGAIATHDEALLAKIRRFRNHGMAPVGPSDDDSVPWPYDIEAPGSNFRLSEFHAAVGLVQARRVEQARQTREVQADRYHAALRGLPAVRAVPPARRTGSAHHLFPMVFDLDQLRLSKREVISFFRERQIFCQVHYTPLHRLEAFRSSTIPEAGLPVVGTAHRGLLSLPLWYGLAESEQDRVIEAVEALVLKPGSVERTRSKH